MSDDFKLRQYEYWTKEASKYLRLFVDKSLDKNISESDLDLYKYAMWYCQEQKRKYY